jgi:hypothetical protein
MGQLKMTALFQFAVENSPSPASCGSPKGGNKQLGCGPSGRHGRKLWSSQATLASCADIIDIDIGQPNAATRSLPRGYRAN